MCLLRDVLPQIMKPRLRAQVVKGMSALPTRRGVGWALGKVFLFDFIRRAFVLSSFSFSLLWVIQVFTSEMHVCMVRTAACTWLGGQDWSSCVSSAKKLAGDRMSYNQRGERCRMKNEEDRTKNWTPRDNSTEIIFQAFLREATEQFCLGQGCPLSDVVHPAFHLSISSRSKHSHTVINVIRP